MGCDIHPYIETCYDGEWRLNDILNYPNQRFPSNRYYTFFSFLAGVRSYGDDPPYREAHGIPHDCCDEIRTLWEENQGWCHTPSWYPIDDLLYGIENYSGVFETSILTTQDVAVKYEDKWNKFPPEMVMLFNEEWSDDKADKLIYVKVRLPFKYIIGKDTLQQIIDIKEKDAPNYSRVVFWFDN